MRGVLVIRSRTSDRGRMPVRGTVLGVGAEFYFRFHRRVHYFALSRLVSGQTPLGIEAYHRFVVEFHKTGSMDYASTQCCEALLLICKAHGQIRPVLDLA